VEATSIFSHRLRQVGARPALFFPRGGTSGGRHSSRRRTGFPNPLLAPVPTGRPAAHLRGRPFFVRCICHLIKTGVRCSDWLWSRRSHSTAVLVRAPGSRRSPLLRTRIRQRVVLCREGSICWWWGDFAEAALACGPAPPGCETSPPPSLAGRQATGPVTGHVQTGDSAEPHLPTGVPNESPPLRFWVRAAGRACRHRATGVSRSPTGDRSEPAPLRFVPRGSPPPLGRRAGSGPFRP
jgi:hypothetical protein